MSLSTISRRRFLQLTAAAPVLAALGADEPFALPLAVFSKVYQEINLSYEESAALTAETGLDGIDCAVRPKGEVLPERAADDMPRYAEILQKHKKRMMLLTTGITGVASPNAETILRTAKKLGIQYYRLGYWKQVPVDKIQAQLRELAALNRDIGVCALFQNHSSGKGRGSGYAGGNLTEMYDIIKDLPPDQIGVAFDLGHALLTHGDDWPAHFERLKPWFKIAYVKDSKRPDGFVPFGEGEFGKTDFLHRLRQMNYRAPLSVHIEFPWSPKDRATLVKTLTDSQRIVRQWLSRA